MKKLFIILFILVFLLFGCNKSDGNIVETTESTTEETTEEQTTKIEYHVKANNFPIICYDSSTDTCIEYQELTYEWIRYLSGDRILKIYLKGQKLYGSPGISRVHYTLKDSKGYIAASGYCYSASLITGDKFKNMCILIENIEEDNYILELEQGFNK